MKIDRIISISIVLIITLVLFLTIIYYREILSYSNKIIVKYDPQECKNLILNGDFEKGNLDGWYTNHPDVKIISKFQNPQYTFDGTYSVNVTTGYLSQQGIPLNKCGGFPLIFSFDVFLEKNTVPKVSLTLYYSIKNQSFSADIGYIIYDNYTNGYSEGFPWDISIPEPVSGKWYHIERNLLYDLTRITPYSGSFSSAYIDLGYMGSTSLGNSAYYDNVALSAFEISGAIKPHPILIMKTFTLSTAIILIILLLFVMCYLLKNKIPKIKISDKFYWIFLILIILVILGNIICYFTSYQEGSTINCNFCGGLFKKADYSILSKQSLIPWCASCSAFDFTKNFEIGEFISKLSNDYFGTHWNAKTDCASSDVEEFCKKLGVIKE